MDRPQISFLCFPFSLLTDTQDFSQPLVHVEFKWQLKLIMNCQTKAAQLYINVLCSSKRPSPLFFFGFLDAACVKQTKKLQKEEEEGYGN